MVSWVCGLYGIRDVGDVKYTEYTRCWGVQTLEMWDIGDMGCWGYWMLGMRDLGDVGSLGFGIFGMWDFQVVVC